MNIREFRLSALRLAAFEAAWGFVASSTTGNAWAKALVVDEATSPFRSDWYLVLRAELLAATRRTSGYRVAEILQAELALNVHLSQAGEPRLLLGRVLV